AGLCAGFVRCFCFFFFQAEDGIRDFHVTGVQTCALPISSGSTTFRPHTRGVYEAMARRDDIARRLEELLVEVQEWAAEDVSEEAREVLETLEEAADLIGVPPEESDS